MASLSDGEQETIDFDWYGVDEAGHIGHFTSAGFKRLPRSVVADSDGLDTLTAFFLAMGPTAEGHRLREGLDAIVGPFKDERERVRCLENFVAMADRGLYSFDIASYVRPRLAYCKVAGPARPVTVNDLPVSIQRIISRTLLKGITLAGTLEILYESTLAY